MTREEKAIQILEQRECCRECVVGNCTCAECDEAFDMAIEALQAQADGDLISRQAVKEAIHTLYQGLKLTRTEDDAQRCIDELQTVAIPSAEPCEDAISRQAVLDLLEDTNNGWIINEVSQLPSVKQQPKTGHWIEHPEIETSTPEYLMFYECSECGDKQCFCKSDIHKKHFCNNCGAKMVEPQESEE